MAILDIATITDYTILQRILISVLEDVQKHQYVWAIHVLQVPAEKFIEQPAIIHQNPKEHLNSCPTFLSLFFNFSFWSNLISINLIVNNPHQYSYFQKYSISACTWWKYQNSFISSTEQTRQSLLYNAKLLYSSICNVQLKSNA